MIPLGLIPEGPLNLEMEGLNQAEFHIGVDWGRGDSDRTVERVFVPRGTISFDGPHETGLQELPLTFRRFAGVRTVATHDRLNKLWYRVKAFMKDGQWRTLEEIQQETGGLITSVSAKLRDMRKQGFGAHTVNKKERAPGLWEYQLILNPQEVEATTRRYFHAKHPGAPHKETP